MSDINSEGVREIWDERYLRIRRLALIALLACLAVVLSYMERLLPLTFSIPGLKLGLANLVILAGLYILPWRDALLLTVLKCLLPAWLFGSLASLLYSLSGSFLSLAVMCLLLKVSRFRLPLIAVSMLGAVAHNLGQLLAVAATVHTTQAFYYLPVLMPASLVTGALIGTVVRYTLPKLPRLGSGNTWGHWHE